MKISFFSSGVGNAIRGKAAIREWIQDAVRLEGFELASINIIQCSNNYLLQLNKQFLNHDYYTDVITFPIDHGDCISGEIYISVEQARIQAVAHKHTLQKELQLLVIHGVMHLCGYLDSATKDRKLMREKELQYLGSRPEKLIKVSRET